MSSPQYHAAYRTRNREKIRRYNREYHAANREAILARQRARHAAKRAQQRPGPIAEPVFFELVPSALQKRLQGRAL
jgi:hypothetical protein